ncbi:MAG TPA: lysophospholipid acyltransferase family protein [Gemmataceae bacterium]|jgi:1-acyl-sn-glycerol-3-phosphate acyltransferase|nr:lysophospholipid acyltransferase family protein [Gemmataceae bacterium]
MMSDWTYEPAQDLNLVGRARASSLKRESDLLLTAGHLVWGAVTRAYFRVWHRLEVIGREHLPTKPPFVLIGNHASHLDALILAAPLPLSIRDRVFPLAAGDVFFEKTTKAVFAMSLVNALPLWRRKCTPHALAELRQRLVGEPCAYILFPEGGRSRDGAMMPFKPGLGMIVAGVDVPVVPCHISGAFEALPANCRVPRPHKIVIKVGPALRFGHLANRREGWEESARCCEAAVRGLGGTSQ